MLGSNLKIPGGSPGKLTPRRQSLVLFFDTSSYMAVPTRATLVSALVLVPYMTLVPAVSMLFSSSILTTSLILIIMQQSLSVFRFPVTLIATFTELSTIQKRAHLKSRAERQKMEREEALKNRMINHQHHNGLLKPENV